MIPPIEHACSEAPSIFAKYSAPVKRWIEIEYPFDQMAANDFCRLKIVWEGIRVEICRVAHGPLVLQATARTETRTVVENRFAHPRCEEAMVWGVSMEKEEVIGTWRPRHHFKGSMTINRIHSKDPFPKSKFYRLMCMIVGGTLMINFLTAIKYGLHTE